MDVPTAAVVLAAGAGKGLEQDLPQELVGLPLVCHAVNIVQSRSWWPLVLVVNPSNKATIQEVVDSRYPGAEIKYVEQAADTPLVSTVNAGANALSSFMGNIMVLPANMPLLQPDTTLLCLEAMIQEGNGSSQAPYAGLMRRGSTQSFPVFCADKSWLLQALHIAQGATTDVPGEPAGSKDVRDALSVDSTASKDFLSQFAKAGFALSAASEDDLCVVSGPAELTFAEKVLKSRLIAQHQAAGVYFRDPEGTFLDADVVIGKGSSIGVGVQLYGKTRISKNVRIEGPTAITNSVLEEGVFVRSFSVLEGAHIGQKSGAGPFARLREGTAIGPSSYVGNFVETKNAKLGRNTLACHLTYLGDAEVGSRTNIGAGTITCNFNGVAKNSTKIGDNAFVGSNSTVVAPVEIGDNAVVAAGSTITRPVPEGSVSFGRARQVVKGEYAETLRENIRANSNRP